MTSEDVVKLLGSGIVGGLISLFARELVDAEKIWKALSADVAGTFRLLARCEKEMIANLAAASALWKVVHGGNIPNFQQVTALRSGWVLSPSGIASATSLERMQADRQAFLLAYLDYWYQVQERERRYRETVDALLKELAEDKAGRPEILRMELACRVEARAKGLLIATRKLITMAEMAMNGRYERLSEREIAKIEACSDLSQTT